MKRYLILAVASALVLLQAPAAEAQTSELKFSHKLHSESVGAACTDCHSTVTASTLPTDDLLPNMESCYTCHDREAECTLCHSDVDNAKPEPRLSGYISKFPHARHVSDKVTCTTCHTGITASETVGARHLPRMGQCSTCHDDLAKPGYCYDCHAKGEKLAPASHTLDWPKAHGIQVQTDQEECKQCHSDDQCIVCHKRGNLDRKAHPLNFIHNHGLLARGNKEQCLTCHEDQSYCSNCHRSEMVLPRTHASAAWSNPATGGTHARAARADMDECTICHSDAASEPICAQCHTAK
ncbi:MAG TPA: cytochrome c3 family protein [bacterium]|nr:cytochrome c3 family protein [bacterium]HPR88248.1 cytochrome c3 family protein [bacterium]